MTPHPQRCLLIECCGKCQFAAYRSPTEQYCNHHKPMWIERLDQWTDGISNCCPLPIYTPKQSEQDKVLNILRPQVLYFALRMEEKLRKHDKERGSRGWVGYTQPEEQEYLLNRLIEEVDELKKDVKRAANCGEPLVSSSPEWTDVGNMAMMGYTAYYGDDTCISMINYMMKELRSTKGDAP